LISGVYYDYGPEILWLTKRLTWVMNDFIYIDVLARGVRSL